MRCLDAAQIARAVATGIDEPHLGQCLECRRHFEADRTARDAIRILPVPSLTAAHKRTLAAEILATAQLEPPRRRHLLVSASALAAAAAAIVLLLAHDEPVAAIQPDSPAVAATEATTMFADAVAQVEAPPALASPLVATSRSTVLSHVVGRDRDVLKLFEGTLDLDTRSARQVDVRVGDAVIRVDNASVQIRARQQAIVSVKVIVGSARIDSGEQHVMLQRDSVWLPGPTAAQRSLTAFRDGWLALRAGRNQQAIELFDRVTDPVAREEASYWAAVAAKRSGDSALAAERLARFLREFPSSQYAIDLGVAP